jgi:threonine dehydrogenase-like Zn-dependent dehydrogenase
MHLDLAVVPLEFPGVEAPVRRQAEINAFVSRQVAGRLRSLSSFKVGSGPYDRHSKVRSDPNSDHVFRDPFTQPHAGVVALGDDTREAVVMPFAYSDGTCEFCHEGLNTSCVHGGFFGVGGPAGGAQAEAVRVPQADGTLFALPVAADSAVMSSLLSLSDVMGTGHHAAVSARVSQGKKVAVIGDGAVGLCGVIAAKRLGAEQIIILGRYPDRIALAKDFGATDIVSERGEEAAERVRKLTGGAGAHSILECVGTEQSMLTAIGIARPAAAIGRVGVPHYAAIPASQPAFYNNISVSGGPAPVRAYITELLPDILEGKIRPGRVFDRVVGLDQVPEGYRAMNERESIKVLVVP